MSQDSEEFTSLRRLLALKRHEQPPPRYFHDFSGHVIARIKVGERVDDTLIARLLWEAPWLQRAWAALESKPILAGAFGAAVCILLIWGVLFSEKADVWSIVNSAQGEAEPVTALAQSGVPSGNPALVASEPASDEPLLAKPVLTAFAEKAVPSRSLASADPSPNPGIFDLIPKPKAETASAPLRLDLAPRN